MRVKNVVLKNLREKRETVKNGKVKNVTLKNGAVKFWGSRSLRVKNMRL